MAAAWWPGAWRSSGGGGGSGSGDYSEQPIRHRNQRPTQADLADYIHGRNFGISSSTAASGTCTLSSSNTTYTTTSTTASSSNASALALALAGRRAFHSLMAPPDTSTLAVEGQDVEEAGAGHERLTDQEKMKIRQHIRDLIIHGSSPAGVAAATPTSDSSGTALDRWLWELQVSWVLHLAELDAPARRTFVSRRLRHTVRSWVQALLVIGRSIVSFTGSFSSQQDKEEEEAISLPVSEEFVGFFAATFSQMLPFVDTVVALKIIDPCGDDHRIVSGSGGGVASAHKFQALTDVRGALSAVLEQVQLWDSWLLSSSPELHAEATRTSGQMCSLLVAKLDKLDEAIRDARDYIRTQFMSLTRETPSELDLSPGIHKATKSAISYITVLSSSYNRSAAVDPLPAVHEAASFHVHGKDNGAPAGGDENTGSSSANLIMVMIRSLEEKLTRVSESFQDQSLRFLFLTNNFYFIWHQLRTNRLVDAPMYALTHKIDGYINNYMRVSWTPVLKPLQDHTPRCCTRYYSYYSAETKFRAEFEKIYTAQKLWKVPDPELREELRTAIIKKVIPAFTNFLEDKDVSAARVTPKELEEMLEELFEG